MSELSSLLAEALVGEYRMRAAELHGLVDSLADGQFWQKPYPYGNSVGHLVLHLTGNLNYYIGAQIAGTGYLRDRDREFSDPSRPRKASVLAHFDETIALVVGTLEAQWEPDWARAYTAEGEPQARNRFTIFLRCAAHLGHHIGQIHLLLRELAKT